MTSYYTIVRYVPDPIADERVNFGVIVFGDGSVQSKFLRDWRRVRGFGRGDIEFLKQFAHDVESRTADQLALPDVGRPVDEAAIREMIGGWVNSIQFAEAKASLLSAAELLQDVADRYLLMVPPVRKRPRDRRAAARFAATEVTKVLAERVGREVAESLVKRNQPVQGRVDQHQFDVIVENSQVYFTAHGLSFEGKQSEDRAHAVQATFWAVNDLRARYPDLPIGIVTIPPRDGSESYDHARRVFEELKATVLMESEVEHWARQVSTSIAIAI